MDQQLIIRIVEAALLAANQPLTLAQLHALFPEDQPAPADSVEKALETLREQSAGRGVELVEVASGFRYQVQADVHPWVARLWTERQTRYTRATLETLALIAYRQPITRGEIEQIRGVTVNSNIIKALEEREWIRVVGHRDMPGKPELLGTTKGFLDYFGLKRLDELPPLSELKDFGDLEPQLKLDGERDALPIGDLAVANADTPAGTDSEDGIDDEVAADSGRDDLEPASDDETTVVDSENEEETEHSNDPDTVHDDEDVATHLSSHPESQDESNDPALADDGDSTRSI
ncbi:segregation and condensation protein B [Luteimonas cucumeris]|uniref:Segregation and condensation protein B n=1 Tax=Luteimonas cucumeris TaxID=985012 RepID=A0A562L830_9GAMM|nr:segregation and condensation protein B [Luteimonas cucumeris]